MENDNTINIYFYQIEDNFDYHKIMQENNFINSRIEEIENSKSEKVRVQKTASFMLLKNALLEFYNVVLDNSFIKNEYGKWGNSYVNFSISHSNRLVAIAISKNAVGVDIESLDSFNRKFSSVESLEKLTNKIANVNDSYTNLCELWTKKESAYKGFVGGVFKPKEIQTNKYKYINKIVEFSFEKFNFSLCFDTNCKVNYYEYKNNSFTNIEN